MPVDSQAQGARLAKAARDKGYNTATALAEAMGRKESTVRSALNGTRPLTADTAHDYAQFLGVTEQWLLYGTGQARANAQDPKPLQRDAQNKTVASPNAGAVTFEGRLELGPKDLPILGYVKAGEDGVFIDNGEIQGRTNRPDSLLGVTGAYGVRVHDVSLLPALQPGWLVHVDPHRPCRKGDFVVIQMNNGAAFVKILERRTDKYIICSQLNPAGEVKYETKAHRSIHRVVGAKFLEE